MKKTISFKLITDRQTNEEFGRYFLEFGKAVNFFLKNIHKIRNSFANIPKKEQKESVCPVCKNKTILIKKNISNNPFKFLLDKKTIDKLKEKGLPYEKDELYKILPEQEVCSYCYGFVASDNFIRKQMYPNRRKNWLIKNKFNVENSAKLSGTEFAMAFEQAKAILKSQKEQQKYVKSKINFLKYTIRKNLEVFEDKDIEVEEEMKGKKVTRKVKAKIVIPAKTKRHKERYKHYMDNEKYGGKTLYSIEKSIEKTKNQIEKLEKRVSSFPTFNSKVVQLHNSSSVIEFLDNNQIKLRFGDRKYQLNFYGTNVKNEKGIKRFQEALKKIRNHSITYSHIVKRDNEFYLEYPMTIDTSIPNPSYSFIAMGIDRGVKKILVCAIINNEKKLVSKPLFVKGDDIWKSRIIYRNIIRRLKGVRRKNRKMREFRGKVRNISRDLVQKESRRVIENAKEVSEKLKIPIVIVLENLKGIKEPQGKKKYKREAKLRFMISTFIYGQIQKAIEYKAEEEGIPTHIITEEETMHTSQQCSKCGDIRKENRKRQGYFKCKNCNYQINADLNAAINIADRFYEKFK